MVWHPSLDFARAVSSDCSMPSHGQSLPHLICLSIVTSHYDQHYIRYSIAVTLDLSLTCTNLKQIAQIHGQSQRMKSVTNLFSRPDEPPARMRIYIVIAQVQSPSTLTSETKLVRACKDVDQAMAWAEQYWITRLQRRFGPSKRALDKEDPESPLADTVFFITNEEREIERNPVERFQAQVWVEWMWLEP
jgi:hypothetical protein